MVSGLLLPPTMLRRFSSDSSARRALAIQRRRRRTHSASPVVRDSSGGAVMFFQTVLVSLLLILMGLALCFAGYRFFVILLPIWGFFAGFQFGASILSNLFGQGFLTTVIGWVIGLLVGIFAAVLAYLFYAAAVVLLAGFAGYQLGVGILTGFGVKEGFLTFLVGLVVGLALL